MIILSKALLSAFNKGKYTAFLDDEFQSFATLTVKKFSLTFDFGAHLYLNLCPLVR